MKKLVCFILSCSILLSIAIISFAANGYIANLDFYFANDRVTIQDTKTSPMIFNQTIKNCNSLTFNYWLSDESGAGRWVAYRKLGKDGWHKIQDFIIDEDDLDGSVIMNFDNPISFDQLAICKTSRYGFSYNLSASITDVYCDTSATQKSATPSGSNYTAPKQQNGSNYYAYLDFNFGSSTDVCGTSTHPLIFGETVKNCKSFVYNYELSNDSGAGRWVAYYKDGNKDVWHKFFDFIVDEDELEGSVYMTFDYPTTFDRLAICKTSRYGFEYSNSVSITDVYCN